jgi:L-ascorbate metabolism protein UlaG (beta-lactamase superfamily)
MEITYIGHSCFKIKGKEITIVIDPYDPKIGYKLPKLECDILLSSHNHADHSNIAGVTGYRLLINSPGEYETSGVFVYGIPVYHDGKQGAERGENIIFLIEVDDLSKETLEKISDVDVLMIPVGGKYTIGAETAAEVISEIEPSYVLPMHYKTVDSTGLTDISGLDKFLDEMGIENNVKKDDKLKIGSKSDVPDETQVVILNPAH